MYCRGVFILFYFVCATLVHPYHGQLIVARWTPHAAQQQSKPQPSTFCESCYQSLVYGELEAEWSSINYAEQLPNYLNEYMMV